MTSNSVTQQHLNGLIIIYLSHQCTMDFANSFPIKSFWAGKP